MKTDKKRVIVIDALNMFLRAYIVDPSLSTNGDPIGGIKGSFKIQILNNFNHFIIRIGN